MGNEIRSVLTDERRAALGAIATELEQLHREMRTQHRVAAVQFKSVHASHQRDAQNLVDFLTLRSHDLRPLQAALAEQGLSSLGRADEHVLATVEAVLENVDVLLGNTPRFRTESAVGFGEGQKLLDTNTASLLGPVASGRETRILVTMPAQAADDASLVQRLLRSGMDSARINCAHESPPQWRRMIANIRREAEALGRECRVLMDLPGPKVRTGPILPKEGVVRISPKRDGLGRVLVHGKALLVPSEGFSGTVRDRDMPVVPLSSQWLQDLGEGDSLAFTDSNGAMRTMVIVEDRGQEKVVGCRDLAYLASGCTIHDGGGRSAVIGSLPAKKQSLILHRNDVVTLTSDMSPADPDGVLINEHRHFRIGCSSPEALAAVRRGQQVWFDDGKIGGIVRSADGTEVTVEIDTLSSESAKLGAEKGINLPDTEIRTAIITGEQEPTLAFIATHADVLGLSFTQRPEDVLDIERDLARRGRSELGLVIKIETALGFRQLPELLLTAMSSERVGVMVARGDLAVECGFERLAELQEEMLWLCAAAHLPVIWATQVLDLLANTGQPSRAEISDAVMSGRAECVMLNKGAHIVEAVTALDDILQRMSAHQHKKVALLRRLNSWPPIGV